VASENTKPELRHEFIAMVFAFAVGDIGLQLAPLMKLGWVPALFPAYSHLTLASVVIAASFVGWTQSPSAGGRRDVKKVLELEFIILLMDMFLVLMYFMLVRAYDFTPSEDGKSFNYTADAGREARWIVAIFAVYLLWDILAKVFIVDRMSQDYSKTFCERVHDALPRMIPTVLCLIISILLYYFVVRRLKPARVIIADATLICLILLFRAFKDFSSAFYSPRPKMPALENKGFRERYFARREHEKLLDRWDDQVSLARRGAIRSCGILLSLVGFGSILCCISRPILPDLSP
jgi:hypothetical protein